MAKHNTSTIRKSIGELWELEGMKFVFSGNLHLIGWLHVPTRAFPAMGHFTVCHIYGIDYNVLEHGGSTYWNRGFFGLILSIFLPGLVFSGSWNGCENTTAGWGEERRRVTKDEEEGAVAALSKSSIGFPSTLLFACYHCSWSFSETRCLFQHIIHVCFFKVLVFASPSLDELCRVRK